MYDTADPCRNGVRKFVAATVDTVVQVSPSHEYTDHARPPSSLPPMTNSFLPAPASCTTATGDLRPVHGGQHASDADVHWYHATPSNHENTFAASLVPPIWYSLFWYDTNVGSTATK